MPPLYCQNCSLQSLGSQLLGTIMLGMCVLCVLYAEQMLHEYITIYDYAFILSRGQEHPSIISSNLFTTKPWSAAVRYHRAWYVCFVCGVC